MGTEWIGLGSTLAAALLAFLFGRVNLTRASRQQREEDLRRSRVEAYATFCAGVVEYRRAQLHRWFAGQDYGSADAVERERPEIADDLRTSRAAGWSAYYRVVMICEDAGIVAAAKAALATTRTMKESATAEELNARSDQVHATVEAFARLSRASVLATDPLATGPWSRLRRALGASPPSPRRHGAAPRRDAAGARGSTPSEVPRARGQAEPDLEPVPVDEGADRRQPLG